MGVLDKKINKENSRQNIFEKISSFKSILVIAALLFQTGILKAENLTGLDKELVDELCNNLDSGKIKISGDIHAMKIGNDICYLNSKKGAPKAILGAQVATYYVKTGEINYKDSCAITNPDTYDANVTLCKNAVKEWIDSKKNDSKKIASN